MEINEQANSEVVYGRNAVTELIKGAEAVDTLYVSGDPNDKALGYIVSIAKEKGAVIKQAPASKLQKLCGSERHQGVAVFATLCEYCELDDIFNTAAEKGEAPFIIIADGIEDPHNLGAIIRTAECVGAHGLIIPKRHGCSVTSAVHRTSAGAISHLNVMRAVNLASVIREIKERGVFCYCADADGENCYGCNLTGASALVIGSEGYGVSRLVRDLCDVVVSLPMKGEINSLNASVAAGVLMYEIRRQRDIKER